MPPPERRPLAAPSLRALAALAGRLDQRYLIDEAQRFPLAALAGASTLAAPRHVLEGARVLLVTASQLGTALALLELDGVADRIVLCPPDLPPAHLRAAAAAAEAGVVVADQELPDLTATGLAWVRAGHLQTAPPKPPRRPRREAGRGIRRKTEWALFTSGTTGPPKLALYQLQALTGAIAGTQGAAGGTDAVWATFYDIRRYGGLQILLRALIGGGSMVLSGSEKAGARETAGAFLARAGAAGVTFISGTPTHWRRALLSPAAASIEPSNVRLSGEIADQAVLDKLRAAYPRARICHAFAATEAGVAFEVCDGLAGFPAGWVDATRGDVELRVGDATLLVRSPRTAERYLGPSVEPLRGPDGFVDTRDLVERRGARYHFIGRRDGVINVGGFKVHPEEVEAIVNRHPRVEMSLVRARRSPIIGQVVVVDVVLRAGNDARDLEAEILETCRGELAAHKVPAMVRVVPSLAVSAAGKLVRPVG